MVFFMPSNSAFEPGIRVEQTFDGHGGIGGRALGVIVLREKYHVVLELLGEGNEPLIVVGGIGSGEGGVGKAGADGLEEVLPFDGELFEIVIRFADSVMEEKIGLIAELEGDELGADGVHDFGGFIGGFIGGAGAHVQAVDQLPAAGVEEVAQIVDGLWSDVYGGGSFVSGVRTDSHAEGGRIGFVAGADIVRAGQAILEVGGLVGIGSPVTVFAGVAADAQDAGLAEAADEACEFGVRRRKRKAGCRVARIRS